MPFLSARYYGAGSFGCRRAHCHWAGENVRWKQRIFPVPGTTIPASRLALSPLAPETFQSEIRAMTTECDRMGGINLAQGVCDTPVPAVVEAAAAQAMRDGQNIYTRCDGIARLREAIAAKQQRDYGLNYDFDREVLVASGATAGLHAAAMALLNPGDEVLRVRAVLRLPREHAQVAARETGAGGAGRAGLSSRRGRHARGRYAADARRAFEYAGQPQRQNLFAVRARSGRGALPAARSVSDYRRDLRVLRLRRRAAHLRGHAARNARAHHRDFGLQQNIFDYRLAHWLRHCRCAMDAGHGALPRPDVRMRACAIAGGRGRGPGAVAAELLHAIGRRLSGQARTRWRPRSKMRA